MVKCNLRQPSPSLTKMRLMIDNTWLFFGFLGFIFFELFFFFTIELASDWELTTSSPWSCRRRPRRRTSSCPWRASCAPARRWGGRRRGSDRRTSRARFKESTITYQMPKCLLRSFPLIQGGPSAFGKNYVDTKFEVTFGCTGSHKTLGTILRDPIVPSSVGQVGLSGYSAFF